MADASLFPYPTGITPNPGHGPGGGITSADPMQTAQMPVPNPFDEAHLLDIFNILKRESTEYRWIWEREWLRDLFYVANRQWITFHPTRREWVDKRLQKWMPRPVTNKISETVQAIRTNLAAINLAVKVRPVGNDPQSVAAADIADMLGPLIYEEHNMDQVMREADFWLIATGNACLQISWDKDTRFNKIFIPHEVCSICQQTFPPQAISQAGNTCPNCGGNFFNPALDQQGNKMGEWASFGRGKTTALSPFEYAFPPNITRFDDLPYIIRLRWRDKHWFEANHPEVIGRMQWEKSPTDRSMQIFKSLALTNDVGTGSQFAYLGAAGAHTVEGVTEYELWMRPTKEFPQGLVMRVAGDTNPVLLQVEEQGIPGPLPYKDIDGNPLFPFVHAQYEHLGGRLYGRSAISPLIQKQDQINQLDSLMQLCLQRTSNPVWIIPEDAGIENITGEPGLIVKWRALSSSGQGKPERVPGEELPATFFNLREQYLKDMEELAGCLDGDTKIPCLDGKTRTMRELSVEFPDGGVWVYGYDVDNQRIVPSFVEKAWSTGVKPTVRVSFKEGTEVICTPDHPFLTYGRGYVRADALQEDEAIVPLNIIDGGRYDQIHQPVDRKTEPVHRMVMYGLGLLRRGDSYLDVHHVDNNGKNNDPSNLEVLTRKEHLAKTPRTFNRTSEHQRASSKARWAKYTTKEERRAQVTKMQEGRDTYWDSLPPEMRRTRNIAVWQQKSPEERKAILGTMIAKRRKLTAIERAALGERQSARMKAYWASKTEDERYAQGMKMRSNHRVLKVEPMGECEVFDLTTTTLNFGTDAGVFVHNTYDIIKGQKPTGVEAFSALQLLVERSQSRFTSVYQSRGEMFRRWYGLAIELERMFGPNDRTVHVLGPNRTYTLRHFQNAQLQGQINVQIEDGSNMPRTALGKRAAIEQASQLGLINPADPDQNYALLQNFGLTELAPSLDIHIQSALQIQEAFEQWAQNPVGPSPLVIKPWFNLQIHLNERIKWLNEDKMRDILAQQPALEALVTQHLQQLEAMINPPQQPQPMGPGGPAPPKPGAGGAQAMANSNRNSGAPPVQSGAAMRPNAGPRQMGPV